MKILLVDDDPNVLQALRRRLLQLEDWEVEYAESGADALALLNDFAFDAIVADMRMPGMDGVELLKIVNEQYPQMVRLVLSGYADMESALKAIHVTHQYLRKPCEAEVIKTVLLEAHTLQEELSNPELEGMIAGLGRLPSAPKVYTELNQVLANPNTRSQDIAKIVEKDPALAGKLLQMANSSFYAGGMQLADLSQAVVRLGLNIVRNLVLAAEVFAMCNECKSDHFSWDEFQSHAMETAELAALLLEDRDRAAEGYTAGLLHDIGRLMLATKLPDRFEQIAHRSEASGEPIAVVEKEVLGVTHAEIGGVLLNLWGLPYTVVEAVMYHHQPERYVEKALISVPSAVCVANRLVQDEKVAEDHLMKMGILRKIEAWQKDRAA